MAILSVDLAFRRWSDLGIVVLDRAGHDRARRDRSGNARSNGESADSRHCSEVAASDSSLDLIRRLALDASLPVTPRPGQEFSLTAHSGATVPAADQTIQCEIIVSLASGIDPNEASGPVNAEILAGRLNHLCALRNIRIILLDGPQAWKSSLNGLEHSRVSEKQLNTSGKTGLPGMVKPVTYRAFAEFCLDVYDALSRRGWRRLGTSDQPASPPERLLVESYPHAAWKSLGLKPLPSKRRAHVSDLAEAFGALRSLIPITTNRPPNHDQLQAIVGGLPGLALEERDTASARIVGNPPRREDGHWREGFIVLPVAPKRMQQTSWLDSMRWLD